MHKLIKVLKKVRILSLVILGFLFFSFSHVSLDAQSTGTGAPGLRIDVTGSNDEGDFGVAIQLVVAMTILSLGPSVIMMMTCFTRIIIVLGFVRNAIGVNSAPSSQIIVGLALFLTFFVLTCAKYPQKSQITSTHLKFTIRRLNVLDFLHLGQLHFLQT